MREIKSKGLKFFEIFFRQVCLFQNIPKRASRDITGMHCDVSLPAV
jgi:hypothetical protein